MTSPVTLPEFWRKRASNAKAAAAGRSVASFEDGILEGKRLEREIFASELAVRETHYTEKLQNARENWLDTESRVLAETLVAAVSNAENRIAHALAQVLMPLLEEEALRLALEEAAEAVRQLLRSDQSVKFKLSGPPDLTSRLRGLIASSVAVEIQAEERASVALETGDTVIEIRASEWFKRVQEAYHAKLGG